MQDLEQRISDLLGQMTLEEKIALTIGRDAWHTNGVERLDVAPITMHDGPHGLRKPPQSNELSVEGAQPATCFPTASALASSWDAALVESVGQAIADECQAQDVQMLLGPGINIKRTPLGGRNFEYYSEDPVLAGELGAAFVRGVQSRGVGTSLKHYACNNQEYERMSVSAEIDERTLRELYLAGFERVVKQAQPWTVMASYNRVNGTYVTEHHRLLTEILKQEWGFSGLVVSDWGAVNAKASALRAGLDLEMPGHARHPSAQLAEMVRAGQLPAEAIDAAAERMLRLILRGHTQRRAGASADYPANHALARRAAAESVVLLKNSKSTLPLDPQRLRSVAVIGQFAKQPRYQGSGSSQVTPTQLDTPFGALQGWLGDAVALSYAPGYTDSHEADAQLLDAAIAQARAATLAIVFAGLPSSYEAEGVDRAHIDMPGSHNELISAVCAAQPNTVVVLLNGSAVTMPWLSEARAVVEAGLGGQAIGAALVDVLSGAVNPAGKLAESFPQRLEDTPAFLNYPGEAGVVRYGEGLFVGYRYYEAKRIAPLFPFGYGLSYTSFEYSDIRTSAPTIQAGQTLEVTLNLRNSGARAGKEVVQLYVQPRGSRYRRPLKELKAFAKVALEPGETKAVRLTLSDRDFMLYDSDLGGWALEPGSFTIVVGGSSADAALSADVTALPNPNAPRRVFTPTSLIKDMRADPEAQRIVDEHFRGKVSFGSPEADATIMPSLPVGKLVLFGFLSEAQLNQLLAELNQR